MQPILTAPDGRDIALSVEGYIPFTRTSPAAAAAFGIQEMGNDPEHFAGKTGPTVTSPKHNALPEICLPPAVSVQSRAAHT